MATLPCYLLLSDFDGTVAKTFTPSPHGIGVLEGYHIALEKLSGRDPLPLLDAIGGVGNRAPAELVRAILNVHPSFEQVARTRIESDLPYLLGREPEYAITEALVRFKLDVLVGEIGPEWPKPCKGFLEFAQFLEEQTDLGIKIELGLLTAGHKLFVKRTFRMWGISYPTVAVTDDDVRWRKRPKDALKRVKPAVFPFNLAMRRWMRSPEGKALAQVAYFGDDLVRDGGLARNARVPFGLFNDKPSPEFALTDFPAGVFTFDDWRRIIDHMEGLRQGQTCSEVFS